MRSHVLFRISSALFILLLVAVMNSCNEYRYLLFGKTAQVTTFNVKPFGPTNDPRSDLLFEIQDGGKIRKEVIEISGNPGAGPLQIQYIPGTDDARLAREVAWWWCALPWVFLAPLVVFLWKFWKFYKS